MTAAVGNVCDDGEGSVKAACGVEVADGRLFCTNAFCPELRVWLCLCVFMPHCFAVSIAVQMMMLFTFFSGRHVGCHLLQKHLFPVL